MTFLEAGTPSLIDHGLSCCLLGNPLLLTSYSPLRYNHYETTRSEIGILWDSISVHVNAMVRLP